MSNLKPALHATFTQPFVRSAYNYDTNLASDQSGLLCLDPSLAQQQFKDDNNPNIIMEKFARTGDLTLFGDKTPSFGDYTDAVDYRTTLDRLNQAVTDFNTLPASVRARFSNDPAEFIEFFNDPKNQDEAIKLGLASRKEDLSTPAPQSSPHSSSEGAGVGKSGQQGKPAVRASKEATGSQGDD